MQMNDSQRIAASKEKVWAALNDPADDASASPNAATQPDNAVETAATAIASMFTAVTLGQPLDVDGTKEAGRQIADRIDKIKRELEDVKRTRGLHRKARKRVPYPVVALVGQVAAVYPMPFTSVVFCAPEDSVAQ